MRLRRYLLAVVISAILFFASAEAVIYALKVIVPFAHKPRYNVTILVKP